MKCPVDGANLQSSIYEAEIQVGVCPDCGGAWLEQGELEAIQTCREHDYTEELARMPDLGFNAYELAQAKQGRRLTCPKCEVEMESREYARCSQVMIDACPQCHGIWLDKGELTALEVFFERSRFEARDIRRGFFKSLKLLLTE
jgi:Zn-finger nucleic acid-binding protein